MPPESECTYMACCGKTLCLGCRYGLTREYCPYCNAEMPETEEHRTRLLERAEKHNDVVAITLFGSSYEKGERGFPIDQPKAIEMYRRASEFGFAEAHNNLAFSYFYGTGTKADKKKAKHHWELAAALGHENARFNIGVFEAKYGSRDRAMRHFIIAAKCGHSVSLENVKLGFRSGQVTKCDLEETLRGYQAFHDETKSKHRERAKAIIRLGLGEF